MASSKKYSDEFRRHALRMVGEIHDEGVDQADAIERIADLLSMPLRTLREWVDQAESPPEPETSQVQTSQSQTSQSQTSQSQVQTVGATAIDETDPYEVGGPQPADGQRVRSQPDGRSHTQGLSPPP